MSHRPLLPARPARSRSPHRTAESHIALCGRRARCTATGWPARGGGAKEARLRRKLPAFPPPRAQPAQAHATTSGRAPSTAAVRWGAEWEAAAGRGGAASFLLSIQIAKDSAGPRRAAPIRPAARRAPVTFVVQEEGVAARSPVQAVPRTFFSAVSARAGRVIVRGARRGIGHDEGRAQHVAWGRAV
jgi:hypothetical protein